MWSGYESGPAQSTGSRRAHQRCGGHCCRSALFGERNFYTDHRDSHQGGRDGISAGRRMEAHELSGVELPGYCHVLALQV